MNLAIKKVHFNPVQAPEPPPPSPLSPLPDMTHSQDMESYAVNLPE